MSSAIAPEWCSTDPRLGFTREFQDGPKGAERDATTEKDPPEEHGVGEIRYQTLKWWHVGMLMIAENVSLGILSLPSAVATLGMAPAAILIVFLSGLSWCTGFIIGQFKLRHPHVHSMGDAGEILLGRIGREILGIGQLLLLIFFMASHILTFTVLMNTLTDHGICTTVFGVVGLVICFLAALPRTMDKVYWMSITSFLSILVAIVVTMIAIGVEAKGHMQFDIVRETSFYKGFLVVTNIVFAFIGHVAFFGFIAESEDPRTFPKSLAMLQVVDTVLYLVTALVIYRYAGRDIKSPALSSAGPLMKKVVYGLAIPTVIVAGVVFGHVACKYIYVRILRGTDHMHRMSLLSVGSWVGIALAVWAVAWVVAESVPVFNVTRTDYALPACFWLHMNWGRYTASSSKIFLTICNVIILAIACTMCAVGLYVSGRAIRESSSKASWSCANNA